MKRLLVLAALVLVSSTAHAVTYPEPAGFVTDTVGLLPPPTRAALENKLKVYSATTTIEIAVVIVPTLSGMTEHDYADGLWKQWRIGKKGQDNGVLLLVVPPPEKRAWIQPGYGIQGWLTDVGCAHIVTDVMRPLNLREKRAEAVVAGVDTIIAKLGATPWAERAKMQPPGDGANWIIALIVIAILAFVLLVLMLSAAYSGGGGVYSGGGGYDGGGGGGGGFGGGDSGGGGGGGDSG